MTAFTPGLPDYLNYRRFIAPGVILMADSALLTGFLYKGPDQEYAEHDKMFVDADHLNHDLARYGDGWMLEAHSLRVPLTIPSSPHHCPDPTSAMVYEERAAQYAHAGVYFETRHVLTLTYLPPAAVRKGVSDYFFGRKSISQKADLRELLDAFLRKITSLADALGRTLSLRRLADDELVHFLRLCVTGEDRPVGLPPRKDKLNYVIGSTPVAPHEGTVGALHTKVIGIIGYPDSTTPQMFDSILRLPFPLRMQQRFTFLSPPTAAKLLKKRSTLWGQQNDYSFWKVLWTAFQPATGTDPNSKRVVRLNRDVEKQADSTENELETVEGGAVREGLFTFTVVLQDPNQQTVEERATEVVAEINRLGFSAIIETDNAADALGGSWPGHGTRNARKNLVNTRHFTRLWPTSTRWAGEATSPNPYYPPKSGALLTTLSTGNTPFFFNPYRDSLGNFMVIGPSGAGKSYFLGSMIMAQLQFENAQVNVFDRDAALIVPVLACGGTYYDLEAMKYAPLAHCDQEDERSWARGFIEKLAGLRSFTMTPRASSDIQRALESLGTMSAKHRTLTHFLTQLQTDEAGLREALRYYTLGQPGSMLDGEPGPEHQAHMRAYDMEKLLGQGESISTPVLMHLFHDIARRLDGRPSLLVIDEGWMAAADALFQDYTEESSATNRKKNNAMGLVLHSPGNLTEWDRRDLLLTNMATLVFLPNERALSEDLRKHYAEMGLGSREIRMLAEDLRPRQDYYCVQGSNRRIFQLNCGPFAHAILSKNGRDHKAHILTLREQFDNEWLPVWLAEQGHNELVTQYQHREQQEKEAA